MGSKTEIINNTTSKLINSIIILFVISLSVNAKENFGNIKINKIISIYDGDTFTVNISSYPNILGKKIPIRVKDIDTPELRAKCTKEKTLAIEAKQLTVSTLRDTKVIELKNMQRGKYFRIVADVYVDAKSLADILIENNLAVKYNGGTKTKDWCK